MGVWKNSAISLAPGILNAPVELHPSPQVAKKMAVPAVLVAAFAAVMVSAAPADAASVSVAGLLQEKPGRTSRFCSFSLANPPSIRGECRLQRIGRTPWPCLSQESGPPTCTGDQLPLLRSSLPCSLPSCLQVKATVCASNPTAKICLKDSGK